MPRIAFNGGLMSALSNVVLAMAVVVAGCIGQSPVAPQSPSTSSPPTQLSAPTNLRVASVGGGDQVVISWTSQGTSASGGSGFLVERALDAAGPWSIHRFTQATSVGDVLGTSQHYCYRVAAVASSLSSAPSVTLCIARSAQGVLTSVEGG